MKIPKLGVSGFNGFQQFDGLSEQMIAEFTELNISKILAKKCLEPNQNIESFDISCTWSYTAIGINQKLYLNGAINDKLSDSVTIEFNDNIKQISTNDDLCLVLLNNGDLYKQSIKTNKLEKLQFLNVENKIPQKRKIFELETLTNENEIQCEKIILIKCTQTFSVALTNENNLYCIPTKLHTFPKHIKIKKIACGAEHVLILSTNGDLYSFGSSTRGQCGSGILDAEETPKLIEALAGIKIIDISAGFWHSAAISSFGDLYTWGWNVNGQLGLATTNNISKRKLPSVFVLPQIVDIENNNNNNNDDDSKNDEFDQQINISNVYCGSKHTIIKTECGKLFGCGWNKYGQLGIKNEKLLDEKDNVILFKEINIIDNLKQFNNIICGNWSTILILENY